MKKLILVSVLITLFATSAINAGSEAKKTMSFAGGAVKVTFYGASLGALEYCAYKVFMGKQTFYKVVLASALTGAGIGILALLEWQFRKRRKNSKKIRIS
ncbi:MAG: hypothetical protein UR26_C0001G0079 [candidate division TM6 bacterium GW2011_GWF2_32_72]|nr:MAG: hypothetical protein UR26_C0001G0079 [candidate division TM6 bacterium GW2011_GWF2_32_72]